MDGSTIFYIAVAVAAILLQGYMEKKKRERARLGHGAKPAGESRTEQLLDEPDELTPPAEATEFVESAGFAEYANPILPISAMEIVPEQEEPLQDAHKQIDPHELIIYSELMRPKFKELF